MQLRINKANCTKLANGQLDASLITDDKIQGFTARKYGSGITFILKYRKDGKPKETVLGLFNRITPDVARKLAVKRGGEIADGRDPHQEKQQTRNRGGKTVNALLDLVEKEHFAKIKSGHQAVGAFKLDVRPAIGNMVIYDVKKSDINRMLNIIRERAPTQANRTLAWVRKAFNWYAAKADDDDFRSPIVKGMGGKSNVRERMLDAEEIRDVFLALDECHAEGSTPLCYRPFVHMLFFSATRLRMPSEMKRSEVKGREWIIPKERNKGGKHPHLVTLTDTMLALIKNNNSPYVFSSDGGETDFKGFSKAKKALDKKLAEIRKRTGRKPFPAWRHHDLRRTARFIMGQNGVLKEYAEKVLGHIQGGIVGVYDPNEVYAYQDDKAAALVVLDKALKRIRAGGDIKPKRGGNVVAFRKTA
jgi:integrase